MRQAPPIRRRILQPPPQHRLWPPSLLRLLPVTVRLLLPRLLPPKATGTSRYLRTCGSPEFTEVLGIRTAGKFPLAHLRATCFRTFGLD